MNRKFLSALLLSSLVVFGISTPANATLNRADESSTLTIFAASSLNVTFPLIQAQFERKHPGVKVQFSFLSSSVLANQIVAGAPADVFASASEKDMATAKARVPVSTLFAANRIVVAFPKSGKFDFNKLVDLNKPGLKWIQCTHSAPCGTVADASLASFHKVTSKPVSYEANVASVVAKLIAGEVDAAIVYHSDLVAHKDILREIRFPDVVAATTKYPIGVVTDSKNLALAQAFVDAVLSANGRKIMSEAGFVRAQ